MSYTAEVTREGDEWIADVVGVPGAHTSGRNLEVLQANLQEVLGRVLDRQRELAERASEAAAQLARSGWSVRDIGGALHMTPSRVSQILAARPDMERTSVRSGGGRGRSTGR